MAGNESNPFFNFVAGLLIGVGASFLYIRFGIELPAAAGIGQRITSEAIVKTAEFELFNASNSPLVRHRALAVILANRPETFLEIDQAINYRFLNEFIQRHRAGFPLDGPVIVNEPATGLTTISRSKVGTTVVDSGAIAGIPTVRRANESDFVTRAILQQKYPEASRETIEFLVAHPETRANPAQVGRQASLPNLLQLPSAESSTRR
jgi:hypothetical protein